MFELFDRRQEFDVRYGNLPHWYQPGVTYFVTFRTADSVPVSLTRSWHLRRQQWLTHHGFDARGEWKVQLRYKPELEKEFHATFTRAFMEYLDRGLGQCLLKQSAVAHAVADTLKHFDGERYHLGDFILMPNHVHLLVCLLGTTEIESVCTSWKKFSATTINRMLQRSGRLWQEESFDHLVRSPEQFEHLQRYIRDNPKKANLKSGEFLYAQRTM